MLSSESSQPDKPGKNQRYTRLRLFIGAAIILALILIGIIARPQEQTPVVVIGTVYPITPRPRYLANGVAAGNPGAKVRIDVYEDFQCSACREYTLALEPQLMRNNISTGNVYYVFHSFLIIDQATWDSPVKESHQAANAAMCAADQNRFWDYHDMLFNNWTGENVGDFTDPRLVAYAEYLKLDMGKFNACFKANRFKAKIDADIAAGAKLGVNGTPSIFVNGVQVTPGYMPTYNQILQAIDAAQAK
ncbi:MAG: DsbA family protein [Anaerolineaceae bacterium]|jgi:protein-disulfide isomerase